jgi:FtsP/CotA-like multicopper oxidase with cupredoxin domain
MTVFITLALPTVALAEMSHKGHAGHKMNMLSMVMNNNADELPIDCTEVSEDVSITVRAGIDYAMYSDGKQFGYNDYNWNVKPCARVTVNFINEDDVRHQWMLHGLPEYLYSDGMFHIELNGKGKAVGQFIVSGENQTLLVHCDISHHTEKGMKAQLVVGNGSGDLSNVMSLASQSGTSTLLVEFKGPE